MSHVYVYTLCHTHIYIYIRRAPHEVAQWTFYLSYESCHTYISMSDVTHMCIYIRPQMKLRSKPFTSHVAQIYMSYHTHIYTSVLSHTCIHELCHTYIYMSHVTRCIYDSCNTYIYISEEPQTKSRAQWTLYLPWRRHKECLKLQVIFRRRATNHRALLWKMTCRDKASCESSPLCTCHVTQMYKSCNTYIYIHELCHTHIYMSYVTRIYM